LISKSLEALHAWRWRLFFALTSRCHARTSRRQKFGCAAHEYCSPRQRSQSQKKRSSPMKASSISHLQHRKMVKGVSTHKMTLPFPGPRIARTESSCGSTCLSLHGTQMAGSCPFRVEGLYHKRLYRQYPKTILKNCSKDERNSSPMPDWNASLDSPSQASDWICGSSKPSCVNFVAQEPQAGHCM